MDIFLSRNGQQFGPYTLKWLESFLADGTVRPDDLAWTAGREGWVPLRALMVELRPAPESIPASVPALVPQTLVSTPARPEQTSAPVERTGESALADEIRTRPRIWPRVSWRGVTAVIAGVALLSVLVLLMNVPEHVSIERNDDHWLRPHDGYTFVDRKDPFNWQVQWTPGKPSDTRANILAGNAEGTWVLAPGYEQAEDGSGPKWRPYMRPEAYPNVTAGAEPGTWVPDPAYVFVGSATAPNVEWRSKIRLTHIVSAERRNFWTFDDGYDFAPDSTMANPKAEWSPGSRNSQYSHTFAAEQEGHWQADEGYEFVSSNDLRTFSPARTAAVWSAAGEIDQSTNGIDCTSSAAILAVIEQTRDQYAALDTADVHPLLAQHVTAAHDALSDAAKSMRACMVVDIAPSVFHIGTAAYCFMQSKKSFNQCMADLKTVGQVVDAGGKIGDAACETVIPNFAKRRTELAEERGEVQAKFETQYSMRLSAPMLMVTCR